MRTLIAMFLIAGVAHADEPTPFPARTTLPLHPPEHTHERAGQPRSVARYAVPSVSKYDAGGYVGGSGLFHGSATGKQDGTFGTDYVVLGWRPGRIFLRFLGDSPKQTAFQPKYAVDGPRLPDPIAAAPVRKAVMEAKGRGGEKE